MGYCSCFALGAFFNLLSLKYTRRSLQRLRNRYSPCQRRLFKLLKQSLSLGRLQKEGCCNIHKQGRRIKKPQKGKLLRCTSARVRRSFGRLTSWSRFVEEPPGDEIASPSSDLEIECMVDLSQLFLGQKFACGAHSRLYHATYQNRAAAAKLIMPPCDNPQLSAQLNRQFSLEVTLLSRLRHQNIIEFVGACKRPPIYCVITEYLPGGSLKAFLHKHEPNSISIPLVTRIALDVATGMEYLHSQGVIHRDLKSDNLLMTDDYHVKIADFGISCLESQRDDVKGFMGTYRWMAPEMIRQEVCTKKVDVYSFGIVLWELCTGLIPFEDMTPIQAAFAICEEKARPVVPYHCPEDLAKIMQQCWSSNPTERPEFFEIVETLQIFALRELAS